MERIWEALSGADPVRHRQVAEKLSQTFTSGSIKVLEAVVHDSMDYFVAKMKYIGRTGHDFFEIFQ